jgi:hypothetical protein
VVNWLCSRESIKRALELTGSDLNPKIDDAILSASGEIETRLGRWFIPRTQTRYYRACAGKIGYVLDLTQTEDDAPPDLLAVTALTSDNGAVTIPAADYFLEPVNDSPYDRIEIDRGDDTAATSEFTYDDTPQRAHAVTGRWGYSEDTETAGAVAEELDTSETAIDVTNASLVDVGDTLLCESEQMFVSERAALTTGTTLDGALALGSEVVTVAVASGAAVNAGEVILVDAERMLVTDITSNNLTVKRGYDGSVIAAHLTGVTVYAYRTLTVVRGANGTTAATHADTTALSKYVPPADVSALCRALAIFSMQQDKAGHTGTVGQGEGTTRVTTFGLDGLWKRAKANYRVGVFA